MTVALMWEARAVAGRGAELLEWARARSAELAREPLRRELLRAPQDRVLVITWWAGGYGDELPELPEPDAGLVTRPVHRWRFESLGSDGTADGSDGTADGSGGTADGSSGTADGSGGSEGTLG